MTYTLTGMSSLANIRNERSNKDAQLFQMPLPRTDSNQTLVLDLFGTIRTITIDGTFTTADGTISTFISQLDALISGSQTTKVFHSDKSGVNYNVIVTSVDWRSGEGEVNKVDYSISMIQTRA